MTDTMRGVSKRLEELGERVRAARLKQRWDVKSAAEEAGIARDTWKRVEEGLSVRDTSRARVLDFLGLDEDGNPIDVGGQPEDEHRVHAPGARADPTEPDDRVLRALDEMREDLNAMSRRLARVESRTEPVGGADGQT